MAGRIALLCAFALSLGQEPETDAQRGPGSSEEEELHLDGPDGAQDVHEAMQQLVLEIERGLERVDELLLGAGSRDRAREPEREAATSLAGALARGRKVVEDIDRLLELAQHPHPPGGS